MNKFKNLLLLSLIISNTALTNITITQEKAPLISSDKTTSSKEINQKLAKIVTIMQAKQKTTQTKPTKSTATKTKEISINTLKKIVTVISYTYNNSGKLLSKNTLVTVGIIAWPYFKMNPEALVKISETGSGFVVTLNGLIAEGILKGMVNNFEATTKIITLLTVKETGSALAQGFGKLVVEALLGWAIKK